MEGLISAIDFLVHLDSHLSEIIQAFGGWSYLLLFAIVFAETGLVITPFLPGDSLLFVVGTFAAMDIIDPLLVFITLIGAAIIGDTVNYAIGKYFGDWIVKKGTGRLFNKKHMDQTHKFFEKHGGKTIIFARFVPIVRTFAPFVAGIGKMDYRKFIIYNITGALFWVSVFFFGGFFFGNIPVVKDNFLIAIFGMILFSVIPIFIGFARGKKT